MSNYFTLKNRGILNPPAGTDLGSGSNKFANVYIGNQLTVGTTTVDSTSIGSIKIAGIAYPGDDTAADTAGGQTIAITGSGFLAGASVIIDGATVSVVTVVSSTQITFTAPAKTAGSYSLYVINPDGATAISVVGIQFSGVPAWVTAAGSLSTIYEGDAVNAQISATGDAPVIYSLASGALPGGLTLAGNGRIIGTANSVVSSTTYNFTIKATDYQNQDTNRAFSYTVNPESVTFNTPASNQTYSNAISDAFSLTLSATSSAGKSIAYTANALPTGLSLSGATIAGTLSGAGLTTSLITAAAVGSVKTATITLTWTVTSPPTPSVEYLVVAGGGGGGISYSGISGLGGGGGAGGALTGTASISPQTYTITVGAGGAARSGGTGLAGNPGTSSSGFGIVTYPGGGGSKFGDGNAANAPTGTWGSGGGGGTGNNGVGAPGTPGQGFAGGSSTSTYNSGGGGGAGGTATDYGPYGLSKGDGGIGITSTISGSAVNYAGGGGGSGGSSVQGGNIDGASVYRAGGLYGGGYGYSSLQAPFNGGATSGQSNTGAGGGAGGFSSGGGGSGIVIIRYSDAYGAATSTTGSPTVTVAGGYRVYKWTSSGSITF